MGHELSKIPVGKTLIVNSPSANASTIDAEDPNPVLPSRYRVQLDPLFRDWVHTAGAGPVGNAAPADYFANFVLAPSATGAGGGPAMGVWYGGDAVVFGHGSAVSRNMAPPVLASADWLAELLVQVNDVERALREVVLRLAHALVRKGLKKPQLRVDDDGHPVIEYSTQGGILSILLMTGKAQMVRFQPGVQQTTNFDLDDPAGAYALIEEFTLFAGLMQD